MQKVKFNFKGLICPVFTPFNSDHEYSIESTIECYFRWIMNNRKLLRKHTINYDAIEKYAQNLNQNNIKAIMLNGPIGEGTELTMEERKKILEKWLKQCRKLQMMCIVNIGGTSIPEVFELAEHAEKQGVDAVVVLPDLFFKPICEEDLVLYMKNIAQHCPTRPLLYSHIPIMTGVNLSMTRLCDLAEKDIPNFVGLEYISPDLNEGAACLKQNRLVLFGHDTLLLGALVMGFQSATVTMLNICPNNVLEIYDNIMNNKLIEAEAAQEKLIKHVDGIYKPGQDWVQIMKQECNNVHPACKCGPCRKPQVNVINKAI